MRALHSSFFSLSLSRSRSRSLSTSAIQELHNKKITHHDLRLSSWALNDDGVVRLMDFGLNEPLRHAERHTVSEREQMAYIAPEFSDVTGVVFNAETVKKSDVWSLGMILIVLVLGRECFSPSFFFPQMLSFSLSLSLSLSLSFFLSLSFLKSCHFIFLLTTFTLFLEPLIDLMDSKTNEVTYWQTMQRILADGSWESPRMSENLKGAWKKQKKRDRKTEMRRNLFKIAHISVLM